MKEIFADEDYHCGLRESVGQVMIAWSRLFPALLNP